MRKISLFLLLLMIITTTLAWAICGLDSWVETKSQGSYPEKFVGLTVDAVHRVVEAPVEILYYPYDEIKNQGKTWTGLFTGLGKGVYYAGQDIVIAAVNLVSAPIPGAKGYIPAQRYNLFKKEAAA